MARYADAIAWVVANDCTEFLEDSSAGLSVAASLVADLFGKDSARVRWDLIQERARQGRPVIVDSE